MVKESKDNKLSEIQKSTTELVPVVENIAIGSNEELTSALDLSNQIKARIKRVEELRLFFVEDLTRKVNEINAEFRAVRKPLEQMLDFIDSKAIEWRRKEMTRIDNERKIEEEKKRKEFEKEQARLAKIAEKQAEKERQRLAKLNLSKKDEKIELKRIDEEKQAKIDEASSEEFNFNGNDFQQSKTVHSDTGSTTFKKVFDCQIVDPLLIPREYLQVDVSAIKKAVKSGVRVIPGVSIFETETVNRKV